MKLCPHFILFRIGGLRKRRNFFASLVSTFKKSSDPSKMCSNATFTMFNLTSSSLQFTIDVQTERREKQRKGNANRVDTYTCFIRKFPSSVNPDSAEFEVVFMCISDWVICISHLFWFKIHLLDHRYRSLLFQKLK